MTDAGTFRSRPPETSGSIVLGSELAEWTVYFLRCADGSLYCGVTNDLARRIAAHNAGRGARYTAGRRPVALAWSERAASRGDALRRELGLKRLPRASKLALVASQSL